jgi:lactate 2-monooxygenase
MDSHQTSPASSEGGRRYGAYQADIYTQGMFHNVVPTVTTDPNKLEAQAKERMSKDSFNYVAGGAGERATMDANRLAFRQWKVRRKLLLLHLNIFTVIILYGSCFDPYRRLRGSVL